MIKIVYHDAFISKVRSNLLLSAYAKGDLPEQRASSQNVSVDTPTKGEVASGDTPSRSAAVNVETDKETYSSLAIYLTVGVVLLLIVVINLLLRLRRLARHVKDIEAKVVTLNSSNSELNSVNIGYKESIVEQEELMEGMSGKLKEPAQDILGKTDKIYDTDLTDKQTIELLNIRGSGQA